MVGYPESLTDPSFTGQILVLTYPLIGNYGCPNWTQMQQEIEQYVESSKIHVAGLVVTEYSPDYSHHLAFSSLSEWLKLNGIPAVSGVDTRLLTKYLRCHGSALAKIQFENLEYCAEWIDPNTLDLVPRGIYLLT